MEKENKTEEDPGLEFMKPVLDGDYDKEDFKISQA
jgi:hypothetical protein